MSNESDTASFRDQELARRFRQMHREEAAKLPKFPTESELRARRPMLARSRSPGSFSKIAAAVAVVFATALLVTNQTRQDPGSLYTDIMNANPMETDQLMSVSYATSPEIISLPGVYEIDVSSDEIEHAN